MSSCGGERPRDADERGQRITRTDVLTAQFPWEQAPPITTAPTTSSSSSTTTNPPPSIAPHCSCKSLTSSANTSRCVFMHVRAFLVMPGAETLQGASVKTLLVTVLLSVFMFQLFRTVGLRAFSMASETYASGTHAAAFVTCPNDKVAKELARGIVERKLAACVNIIPAITSVYEWKGEIEEDSEVLLMIKTRSSKVPDLAQYVRSNHPYEVAEVISLPIDQGNPPYLKWIADIVPE
ncbi:Protein CutA-like protein [Nibea albiflora]|uniref:Protein CutA-like protein n=1 Tax=Nibea albiflora TaxID=240163 RepID=A0ACB7FJ85_NIBAL|nr:Protein CutA-like protein [Nibea albiflora]